jgi:Rod binding domain-containing protein
MHVQLNSVAAATAPGADCATPAQPRLVRAAHEFEAQMMKELLKPMTNSSLTGEDEDSGADSGSGGALGQFASEALGRALSEQGGFGIANSIVRDLSHSGNKTITGQVTGKLHGNTVMKALK